MNLNSLMGHFNLFFDPSSRIYWPFILSSLLILILVTGKRSLKDALHPSSILDAKIFTINLGLKTFLFPFFLVGAFQVSVILTKLLYSFFPEFQGIQVSDFNLKLILTLIAFVVNDFFRFFHHFLMHKLPYLRGFHRTHHSALVLTPLTLYRAHPIEAFIAGNRNVISLGVTLSLFSFIAQKPMSGFDILGVNLFGFLFNAFLSNLRHSPLPISFGPLEYIFISPRMHQIHHSNNPRHFNKNYGVALSIWDQLAGSFYRPKAKEAKDLTFGLHTFMSNENWEEATTLVGAFLPQKINIKDKSHENESLTSHAF